MEKMQTKSNIRQFGDSQMVEIDFQAADQIAEGYFNAMCGFDSKDPQKASKIKAMAKTGYEVRSKLRDVISIRAVIAPFGSETVRGRHFKIGPIDIECNAFEQIATDHIRNIYAYILTAGSFELDSDSVLDQFYADTWGTAYVDAGRDLLQVMIRDQEKETAGDEGKVFVTDSFGPGYYGMDLSQVEKFFELLDHGAIGVSLNSSVCMLPIKSCTGFFVTMDEDAGRFSDDCRSCLSRDKGCSFCRFRIKGETNADHFLPR